MTSTNKTNLARVTATIEPNLLESVEQHRNELAKRMGIRISTSSAISLLVRLGLEASSRKAQQ